MGNLYIWPTDIINSKTQPEQGEWRGKQRSIFNFFSVLRDRSAQNVWNRFSTKVSKSNYSRISILFPIQRHLMIDVIISSSWPFFFIYFTFVEWFFSLKSALHPWILFVSAIKKKNLPRVSRPPCKTIFWSFI